LISKEYHENLADLGKILFSDGSPMQLLLCLKPNKKSTELDVQIDPFESVNLGVGRRYYLAQLRLGGSYFSQYVLLNAFDPTSDKTAVDELALLQQFSEEKSNPFPKHISFNDSLVTKDCNSPIFFCKQKKEFFHGYCHQCGEVLIYSFDRQAIFCNQCSEHNKTTSFYSLLVADNQPETLSLDDLLYSFGKVIDAKGEFPCSNCLQHDACYSKAENEESDIPIMPFSFNAFALYGFNFYPLRLLDYCELIAGRSKSDLLESLSQSREKARYRVCTDSPGIMQDLKSRNYLLSEQPDVNTVLLIKLRLFLRLCLAVKNIHQQLSESHSTLSVDNIMMDVAHENSAGDSFTRAKISLLPPNNRKNPAQIFQFDYDDTRIWKSARLSLEKVESKTGDDNSVFLYASLLVNGGMENYSVNDVLHVKYSGVEGYVQSVITTFVVKQVDGDILQLESLEDYDAPMLIKQFQILLQVQGFKVEYVSTKSSSLKDDSYALSKILLQILFSQQSLNELKLEESSQLFYELLNQVDSPDFNESVVDQVLLSSSILSNVFRQENILYQAESPVKNKISYDTWLKVLMIITKLSHQVKNCGYLMQTERVDEQNVLSQVIDDIKSLLTVIGNKSKQVISDFQADDELIAQVLTSIIDDPEWLTAVLSLDESISSVTKKEYIEPISSVPGANESLDETVIMGSRKIIIEVPDETDPTLDDTVIMTSSTSRRPGAGK